MEETGHQRAELRLLIVDDYVLVREGLLALFRAAGGVEAAATGTRDAIWVARRFAPHVALLDVAPSDEHAFETARNILALRPSTRLLFLDDAIRSRHVRTALEVGGVGYWTKHDSFDRIAEAVCLVAGGQSAFCPEVRRYLALTAHGVRFEPSPETAVVARLSRRESEVLALLAEGLSVKQCALRMRLAPNTVDNHKSRLMKKLGVRKVASLVRLAVREGLVKEDELQMNDQ